MGLIKCKIFIRFEGRLLHQLAQMFKLYFSGLHGKEDFYVLRHPHPLIDSSGKSVVRPMFEGKSWSSSVFKASATSRKDGRLSNQSFTQVLRNACAPTTKRSMNSLSL